MRGEWGRAALTGAGCAVGGGSHSVAFIKYKMREAIGITAIRASAMVKRECLGIMLGNVSGGAARRKSASLFRKRMCQDYYAWWTGGRFDQRTATLWRAVILV